MLGLVTLAVVTVNVLVTSVVKAASLYSFIVLPATHAVVTVATKVPVPQRLASLTAGAATVGQAQFVRVVLTTLST